MPSYKPKNDPARIRNWIRRARVKPGDYLRLSSMEIVGGRVVVIATWDGREGTQGDFHDETLAEDILAACQEHCDASARGRGEYQLELVRTVKGVEEVRVSYQIRCMSEEVELPYESEMDASPAGQIEQQMRHAEALMRMSVKGPMLAIESLTLALRDAHARIRDLEKERAASLDREIQVLELAAELQIQARALETEPKESLTDSILRSAVGEMGPQLMPMLMKGLAS